jgi:hypothetical protein
MLPAFYPDVQVTPPLTILGKISIDRNGHVKQVDLEGEGRNPDVLTWIRNQMEQLCVATSSRSSQMSCLN